jgi:hypothetical protein
VLSGSIPWILQTTLVWAAGSCGEHDPYGNHVHDDSRRHGRGEITKASLLSSSSRSSDQDGYPDAVRRRERVEPNRQLRVGHGGRQ